MIHSSFTELPFKVQEESKLRTLILVSGFIHDVSSFVEEHPGGARLLTSNSGLDMTVSFFGGYYAHSNAAHNVCFHGSIPFVRSMADISSQRLSMMRVGILEGGVERPSQHSTPELQRLYIAER